MHTVLGPQELFIMRHIRDEARLPGLSRRERLVLATAFTATRQCSVFEVMRGRRQRDRVLRQELTARPLAPNR